MVSCISKRKTVHRKYEKFVLFEILWVQENIGNLNFNFVSSYEKNTKLLFSYFIQYKGLSLKYVMQKFEISVPLYFS